MSRAVAYVRKSNVESERRSLREQEALVRRHAEALGMVIVDVVAEEASAYAERERPAFARALQAVEEGHADAVVAYALDRFSRRGAGHVMALVDKGLRIVTVAENIDTADSSGRLTVAVMAEAARLESERISQRVRRSKAAAREAGRWHAGPAPFGYRTEGRGLALRLAIVPVEAAVIRDAAERIIAGASLTSIVREWNAKGLRTRRGNAWTRIALKGLLTSPTIAGWLPHRGDVVRGPDGAPVVAHEAIVPPPTWRRLQVALKARSDAYPDAKTVGRPRTALLSGLLRCACGSVLTVGKIGSPRPTKVYRCSERTAPGPHVVIRPTVEDVVARAVLRRLAALDPDDDAWTPVLDAWAVLSGASTSDAERLAREDDVAFARERLDRVLRLVADGVISEDEARDAVAPLRDELRRAEARLREVPPPAVDVSVLLDLRSAADDPDADVLAPGGPWDALGIPVQRRVIAATVERIDVAPTRPGTRDVATRLTYHWRT